jgi:hypothetical protein
MTLGRGLTSTYGATFILDEPGAEEDNLEETHYLMVHIERLKKKMLSKIEG